MLTWHCVAKTPQRGTWEIIIWSIFFLFFSILSCKYFLFLATWSLLPPPSFFFKFTSAATTPHHLLCLKKCESTTTTSIFHTIAPPFDTYHSPSPSLLRSSESHKCNEKQVHVNDKDLKNNNVPSPYGVRTQRQSLSELMCLLVS